MEQKNYGKTLENPIKLRSIKASLAFLNNIVTENGNHIIFHRLQSTFNDHPIDCYEIYTSDGKYDLIYFDIYNSANEMIPPSGYFFTSDRIEFLEMDYNLDISFVDTYEIEKEYVYTTKKEEPLKNRYSKIPLLDKYLIQSTGVNYKLNDFPRELITEIVEESILYMLNPQKKSIDTIVNEIIQIK
jgi:hypothetical protein